MSILIMTQRILLYIFVIAFFVFSGCSFNNTVEYPLDTIIKDKGAHPKLIRMFEKQDLLKNQAPFTTPVLIHQNDQLVVETAIVKGADCQLDESIRFRIAVVDYNRNRLFDDEDAMILSGINEDSVLISLSPLNVIGINPMFTKCGYEIV